MNIVPFFRLTHQLALWFATVETDTMHKIDNQLYREFLSQIHDPWRLGHLFSILLNIKSIAKISLIISFLSQLELIRINMHSYRYLLHSTWTCRKKNEIKTYYHVQFNCKVNEYEYILYYMNSKIKVLIQFITLQWFQFEDSGTISSGNILPCPISITKYIANCSLNEWAVNLKIPIINNIIRLSNHFNLRRG